MNDKDRKYTSERRWGSPQTHDTTQEPVDDCYPYDVRAGLVVIPRVVEEVVQGALDVGGTFLRAVPPQRLHQLSLRRLPRHLVVTTHIGASSRQSQRVL